ncbi:hypothetical protein [Prochlorococcus marinus]|nr:hypothetical protein [Prochlorococcus marinus]
MVDFFGNSSETHVKLDIKAIAITTSKLAFKTRALNHSTIPSEGICTLLN